MTTQTSPISPRGVAVFRPPVPTVFVLSVAIFTTPAAAQPPAIAGTWVASRETPASVASAPGPVLGERFGVRLDANVVTLTRVIRGAVVVTSLPITGAEVRATLPGRSCMGDGALVASLTQAGEVLTYSQSTLQAGATQPVAGPAYRLRLQSTDRLVVESTMRTSPQAAPTPVGTVYVRSNEPMPAAPSAPALRGPSASIANLAWLAGDWEGPAGASTVEERWSPAAGGAMLAVSRTTRAGTMSAFEFLCITERGGGLVYTARPNADAPTDFTLTHLDTDSATFENPAHDFPKRIRYVKRPDGRLAATISGADGQRAVTFVFTRRP
jgi:Domain of unknown function (DUF6265)